MTTKNFVVKNGLTVGNVTIDAATGNILALNANLGNLAIANFFSGNGNALFNIQGANVVGTVANANYAVYAGTVTTAAQPNITSVGNLSALTVTGNAGVGGILTDNYYYANGSPVDFQQAGGSNTEVQFNDGNSFGASANFTFNKTTNVLTVAGNIAGDNVNAGNLLTANFVAGTLTSSAQPNITSVGNLSALNVTGNIVTSANLVTDLIVGKTSSVTITATGSNQNINLTPTGTGTVNVGNFIISNLATPNASSDAATKQYVDEVAQGLSPKGSVVVGSTSALPAYTYNNGTDGVGATITANASGALSLDGVQPTVGSRVLVKNETAGNSPVNGIYVVTTNTVGSPFVLTRAADMNLGPEFPGAFTFIETGSTLADTGWVCTTDSPITVGTTAIVFTQFSGAGQYTAGTGLSLDGTVFSIANTTVTANPYGNGDYVATFTVNSQGQLTAAANVAITANAANLTGSTLNASIVTSSLTSVGSLGNLTVTGNANVGNLTTSGEISATYLGGTLTTAAQPNVTSVGTLTGLTVGNGSANTVFGNGIVTATGNITGGNIITAGTANIATLEVTGTTDLGAIANVGITGGTSGQVIQTDGAGNLSFVTISTASISNGNSNIEILNNGNINFSSTGNANVLVVTGSGANITGTLNATGNANVANLGATNVVATTVQGSLTTAAQPNITSVGTLTSLSVTGNVSAGNVSATDVSGTTLGGTLTTAAQPNITSVGTLTSLAVTGNATAGNVTGANLVSANYFTGTLTTAAQPNITSVGNLTSLSVSGNTTSNLVNLTTGLTTNRSNVSVTTATVIDSFDPTAYRTAKYVISASGDDGYQSVETLLVHDGVDAYITIYGSVCSNVTADIIELTSNVNGVSGNVTVYASSSSANVLVNLVASYIKT